MRGHVKRHSSVTRTLIEQKILKQQYNQLQNDEEGPNFLLKHHVKKLFCIKFIYNSLFSNISNLSEIASPIWNKYQAKMNFASYQGIIKSILMIPYANRLDEEIQILQKATKHFEFFKQYQSKNEENNQDSIHFKCCNVITLKHVKKGEVIIKKGDIGDAMYFVLKGRVNVYLRSSESPQSKANKNEILSPDSKQKLKKQFSELKQERRLGQEETNSSINLLKFNEQGLTTEVSNFQNSQNNYTNSKKRFKRNSTMQSNFSSNSNSLSPSKFKDSSSNIDILKERELELGLQYSSSQGVGSVFGEIALTTQKKRTATLIAAEGTDLGVLSKKDFDDIILKIKNEKTQQMMKFFSNVFNTHISKENTLRMQYLFEKQKFPAKRILFNENDDAQGFYIIQSGTVTLQKRVNTSQEIVQKVEKSDPLGKLKQSLEQPKRKEKKELKSIDYPIQILSSGSLFGEEVFFDIENRQYKAIISSTEAIIYYADYQRFLSNFKYYATEDHPIIQQAKLRIDWRQQKLKEAQEGQNFLTLFKEGIFKKLSRQESESKEQLLVNDSEKNESPQKQISQSSEPKGTSNQITDIRLSLQKYKKQQILKNAKAIQRVTVSSLERLFQSKTITDDTRHQISSTEPDIKQQSARSIQEISPQPRPSSTLRSYKTREDLLGDSTSNIMYTIENNKTIADMKAQKGEPKSYPRQFFDTKNLFRQKNEDNAAYYQRIAYNKTMKEKQKRKQEKVLKRKKSLESQSSPLQTRESFASPQLKTEGDIEHLSKNIPIKLLFRQQNATITEEENSIRRLQTEESRLTTQEYSENKIILNANTYRQTKRPQTQERELKIVGHNTNRRYDKSQQSAFSHHSSPSPQRTNKKSLETETSCSNEIRNLQQEKPQSGSISEVSRKYLMSSHTSGFNVQEALRKVIRIHKKKSEATESTNPTSIRVQTEKSDGPNLLCDMRLSSRQSIDASPIKDMKSLQLIDEKHDNNLAEHLESFVDDEYLEDLMKTSSSQIQSKDEPDKNKPQMQLQMQAIHSKQKEEPQQASKSQPFILLQQSQTHRMGHLRTQSQQLGINQPKFIKAFIQKQVKAKAKSQDKDQLFLYQLKAKKNTDDSFNSLVKSLEDDNNEIENLKTERQENESPYRIASAIKVHQRSQSTGRLNTETVFNRTQTSQGWGRRGDVNERDSQENQYYKTLRQTKHNLFRFRHVQGAAPLEKLNKELFKTLQARGKNYAL